MSTRSRYVDDPNHDSVPIGNLDGTQEGVTPPAYRKHNTKYEAVSVEEAMRRLAARRKSLIPKIGLDDNFDPGGPVEANTVDYGQGTDIPLSPGTDPQPEDHNVVELDDGYDFSDMHPGEADALRKIVNQLDAPDPVRPVPTTPVTVATAPRAAPPNKEAQMFLEYTSRRHRLTLHLAESSIIITALDVVISPYSVTVLMPYNEGVSFLPRPGAEIALEYEGVLYECFCPGLQFEIPQLKVLGIGMIRKEE